MIEQDVRLFWWINTHRNVLLDALLIPVAYVGEAGIGWWLLCIGFALWGGKEGRRTALLCVIAIVLTDRVLGQAAAALWHRTRPYLAYEHVRQFGFHWHSNSFPSGHATSCLAGTIVVGWRHRKWLLPLLLFSAATLYSRPYAGMHHPLDSAVGALLGVAAGLVVLAVHARLTRRSKESGSSE